MSKITGIEWTESTLNPITGCTKISLGCNNCYAQKIAQQMYDRKVAKYYNNFKLTLHPEDLQQILSWKKPRKIFIASMGDIFHEDVPDDFLNMMFQTMFKRTDHQYQLLTKRPIRALKWWQDNKSQFDIDNFYKCVWFGITTEDQQTYNKRMVCLNVFPAKVSFISVEPMLSQINLHPENYLNENFNRYLNWVICGGESGQNARPPKAEWIYDLRNQCHEHHIPFFFKSWGEKVPLGEVKHTIGGVDYRNFPLGV